MNLDLEGYASQHARWPASGRHILAQNDTSSVVVYQAFTAGTAAAAVRENRFAEGFSLDRMSWIKPNFLWMMYRAGWATKNGQERVLAIRITRAGFEEVLASAVHSSPVPEVYGDRAAWQQALKRSEVRLQWDPDHGPHGDQCERRAIQLGLSGESLRRYALEWTLSIEDITDFVHKQHAHVRAHQLDLLMTPREEVFEVTDAVVSKRLGVTPVPSL